MEDTEMKKVTIISDEDTIQKVSSTALSSNDNFVNMDDLTYDQYTTGLSPVGIVAGGLAGLAAIGGIGYGIYHKLHKGKDTNPDVEKCKKQSKKVEKQKQKLIAEAKKYGLTVIDENDDQIIDTVATESK